MAIDLEKMKAKLNKLQNKGNGDSVFWRPEDGEQTIRIVPTADGDPFKDYWFHYNLGKNPGFLSPKKNFGEECCAMQSKTQVKSARKENLQYINARLMHGLCRMLLIFILFVIMLVLSPST